MTTFTKDLIKVRAMSIQSKEHPEWGAFGVYEDTGEWLVINGRSGSTVLFYGEMKFWEVV